MSTHRHRATLGALTLLLAAVASLLACGPRRAGDTFADEPSPGGQASAGDVLTRSQIEKIRANSMEQLLDGHLRGVQVLRRDGEPVLRIRGDGDPLLVLNGMPAATVRLLWNIDPADVERIEIIKGTATAVYGVDGANGVVRVTTRHR